MEKTLRKAFSLCLALVISFTTVVTDVHATELQQAADTTEMTENTDTQAEEVADTINESSVEETTIEDVVSDSEQPVEVQPLDADLTETAEPTDNNETVVDEVIIEEPSEIEEIEEEAAEVQEIDEEPVEGEEIEEELLVEELADEELLEDSERIKLDEICPYLRFFHVILPL